MEAFYWGLFTVLGVVVMALVLTQNSSSVVPTSGPLVQAFLRLRNNYVFVYALMMAGDWFQGPYVYALYQHYGYSDKDIGRLFIAGFGASMIFGTVVGSMADQHGRKKAALLYCFTYMMSCVTKHSPDYWVLMAGRLLGGIATSLLFSAFESWLVGEHFKNGLDPSWLSETFSKAVFVGNGLVAILAGLVANYLVYDMKLGPVAPFDAAIAALVVGAAVIYTTWGENYGDNKHNHGIKEQLQLAVASILADQRIALLGAMQALFEAAMYTFVFLWTPALSPNGESIPHGFIFACFMTSCMAGSTLSAVLMKSSRPEGFMKYVFSLGALALVVPFLFSARGTEKEDVVLSEGLEAERGISLNGKVQLIAFCVFEVVVGIFWPSMMTMRAAYVPEDMRSTIINCFRIPLNFFVCVVLSNVDKIPRSILFGGCASFLAISALLQVRLERLVRLTTPIVKGMPEADPLMGNSNRELGADKA